jgi:hypothetical protein
MCRPLQCVLLTVHVPLFALDNHPSSTHSKKYICIKVQFLCATTISTTANPKAHINYCHHVMWLCGQTVSLNNTLLVTILRRNFHWINAPIGPRYEYGFGICSQYS